MSSDLDDRVIRALGALADEAEPSNGLQARSLAPSHPQRWRVVAAAAAVVALVVGAVAVAREEPEADLVTIDEPQPDVPTSTPSSTVLTPQVGESIDPAAAGVDLLVFGDESARLVTPSGSRTVSARPVVNAIPDGRGGLVLQEASEWRSIVWLPADGTPTVLVAEPEQGILHGVHDGAVYFTTRSGEAEDGRETLHRVSLEPGEPEPEALTDTGGTESGLDSMAVADDGRLFLSGCHLQCSISVLGDDEVLRAADWITGLDIAGSTMAFIQFEFEPPSGSMVRPKLVLAGLDGIGRRVVPLGDHVVGSAQVDLADDGSAAVVSYRSWDPANPAPDAQLVDGLAGDAPRVRSLSGVDRARLATGVELEQLAPQGDPAAVVHSFLDALRRGEEAEADTYLSEYARLVSPLDEFLATHSWLVDVAATETYVGEFQVQATGTVPVVTVVADSPTGNPPRHAAAFGVGFDEQGEMRIHRLPTAIGGEVVPAPGTEIGAGDSIVLHSMPVEGGVDATINNAPVDAVVDYEAMTTTIVVPDWVGDVDQIVVTVVFATPELPYGASLWFPVRR